MHYSGGALPGWHGHLPPVPRPTGLRGKRCPVYFSLLFNCQSQEMPGSPGPEAGTSLFCHSQPEPPLNACLTSICRKWQSTRDNCLPNQGSLHGGVAGGLALFQVQPCLFILHSSCGATAVSHVHLLIVLMYKSNRNGDPVKRPLNTFPLRWKAVISPPIWVAWCLFRAFIVTISVFACVAGVTKSSQNECEWWKHGWSNVIPLHLLLWLIPQK